LGSREGKLKKGRVEKRGELDLTTMGRKKKKGGESQPLDSATLKRGLRSVGRPVRRLRMQGEEEGAKAVTQLP